MMRLSALVYCAVLIFFGGTLSGCFPVADNNVDEEKDPHYQRGRSLSSSQDFKGAVDEFEKALETNPRSASAHFELGWLYEEKNKDFAAAIYHYQRHLLLRPNSERAERVKEHIQACKQDLAKSEFSLPNNQNVQRELDRLNAENVILKQQVETLKAQLTNGTATPVRAEATRVQPANLISRTALQSSNSVPVPPERPRVHVIKAGETIASIAQQYGLKQSSVLAANPKVDPRKMRIGQNLNLPAP